MGLLNLIFHFAMMLFGATVPLSVVEYPNTLMLINRLSLIALIIYLIIWVQNLKIMVRELSLVTY